MKIVTNEIDKTRKTCTDFHRVAWTYSHDNQKELNSVFHLISKDIDFLRKKKLTHTCTNLLSLACHLTRLSHDVLLRQY